MRQSELQPRGALPLTWFLPVAALIVVAYANSFTAEFQFDDYEQIWESPVVHDPTVLALLQWGKTRMIPYATLVANYYLGGANVVGYHVVNLLVHLLVCLVVYRLIGELCRTPKLRGTWTAAHALPIAIAATVIVGCHPLQVQAVTYIVQRMTSMAALFYLATVYFYVRARLQVADGAAPGRAYGTAIACALAAYLSKENTASLPLALILVEWVFFRPLAFGSTARRLMPFAVLVLLIPLVFRIANVRPLPPEEISDEQAGRVMRLLTQQARDVVRTLTVAAEAGEGLSPATYLLTQLRVIPRYFGFVVVPLGLTIDHDVATEHSLTAGSAAGLALLLALLLIGLYATLRWPLLGFGILWTFVALSIESSVFPIRDVMNEHRMYLAMPGIALLAGVAFAYVWSRQQSLALVLGGAIAIALVGLTLARNQVWATQLSLWREALARSPNKARPHVNYGTALHLQGDVKQALKHYCEALRLEPDNRRADSNINVALEDLMASDESDDLEMEIATTGPEGEMELVPRHPCPPKPKP